MGAVDASQIDAAAQASSLWSSYAEPIDRESAREMLAAKMQAATDGDIKVTVPKAPKESHEGAKKKKDDDGVVVHYLKSQEGRRMMTTVARGVFGLLKKGR
jgi:hypothetical protein